MRVTLQSPEASLALDLTESVQLLDGQTIEVDCPDFLGGDRMPMEAWQVLDLVQLGDAAGLAEIGVAVVDSAGAN